MLRFPFALAALLLSFTAHAARYDLTWRLSFDPKTKTALGSLELGKDATLFISEGDALDMRTNKLTEAFIQGRMIDLENHQSRLYDKYKEKYNQQ